jgi:hypothetical protein
VSVCLIRGYRVFTFFVVQDEMTLLMFAAENGASMETIQLLLDSGAKASINYRDLVAHLRFNLELWM